MTPMPQPELLGAWSANPFWWTVVALGTVGYGVGVLVVRRSGVAWPIHRAVSWLAAMTLLIVVVDSGVAAYAHHLFWAHMIVHLALIMGIPLLLVVAQPIRLTRDASPEPVARGVERLMTHPVTRFLTSPVFAVPLYTVVLIGTHLTGFQQAMSEHTWIHESETVVYLVSGYLLLLPTIGGEFSGHDLSHPVRFVTLLLSMGPDTMVGVVLMLTDHPLAPAYGQSRMGWGPDALTDQTIAGAIMWFGGDGLMMLLLLVVAGQWIRADRSRSTGTPRRVSWLDRARQDSLGAGEVDIDDDDAALAAYNARLRALHGMTGSPAESRAPLILDRVDDRRP